MALIPRGAGLVVALLLAAGCAAGPGTRQKTPQAPAAPEAPAARKKSAPAASRAKAEAPTAPAARDWESFAASGVALRADIATRADAMKKGPIGNRGVELASLRLAAVGRDLLEAGSLDGALEALERALSLYGRNGYAYLYLAYVHHVQGHGEQATEFAASARRYLPEDEAVRAELEGFALSIREGAATAGR